MYKEFFTFLGQFLSHKSLWKDGELWTALLFGIGSFLLFYNHPDIIVKIRGHFNDILTVTSIIFGFVFTALLFYIQAAGTWTDDEKIQRVAQKIINWHVWTIINLIFLIGYIIILWSLGHFVVNKIFWNALLYAIFAFLNFYIIFQILNHILTVWWVFQSRDRLKKIDTKKN